MTRLYDLDRLRGWTTLPTSTSRWWAVRRWIEDYPTEDLVGLSRLLHDEDTHVVSMVAGHLGASGDERWIPVMLRLRANLKARPAEEAHPGARGRALYWGLVESEAGRAALWAEGSVLDDPVELFGLAERMGHAQPPELRAAVRAGRAAALKTECDFAFWATAMVMGGAREDFYEAALAWRAVNDDAADQWWDMAIASWCGGWCWHSDFRRFRAILLPSDVLPRHLLPVLEHELPSLDEAAREDTGSLLREVHRVVVRLLRARGDDVDAWARVPRQGAVDDYRTLAVGVEAMTRALSLEPPPPGREASYAVASFALLCRLAERVDERRWIAEHGVWSLIRIPYHREIPTVVVSAVVAAGAEAVPQLAAALDEEDLHALGGGRISELAVALHRAGVDVSPLIPQLAARLKKGGDYGKASRVVADSLVKLGPPADVIVACHLQGSVGDVDETVLDVLSRLSSEVSLHALLGWWEQHPWDERTFRALANIHDPRSLAAIEGTWRPGDKYQSEWLYGLSGFVAPDHPMRPYWRRDAGFSEWRIEREVQEDA